MSKKKTGLVVKDNKLIEASYKLTLIEQRIILAAIVLARETQTGLGDGNITIEAKWFAKTFNMDEKSVYDQLREATKTLFDRFITHLTFNFDRKPEAKAATEPKTKPVIKRATKPTVQSAAPSPNQTSNEVKQALRELLTARKKTTPPEIKTKPEPPTVTSSPARSLASIMNELKIGDIPINPALAA